MHRIEKLAIVLALVMALANFLKPLQGELAQRVLPSVWLLLLAVWIWLASAWRRAATG